MSKFSGFCTAFALSALLAAPARAEDPSADTVLATVGGVVITLGDLIVTRDGLPEQYKSLPDDVLFKGILDQLVQQEALMQSLGEVLTKKDTLALADQRRNYLSNVALEDPKTGKATRVRFEERDGKKVRVAVRSGELING